MQHVYGQTIHYVCVCVIYSTWISHRLDQIKHLLPGAEDPTVLPLAEDKSRVAIHLVSSENLFWETMEQLKELGASSILVLPIEKMME